MGDPRVRLLLTLAVLAPACAAVLADNKAADPPADAELLEFLGSVDSGADSQAAADDDSWIDYLSQTDIDKVADPNGLARAKQVATGAQPSASGDKKDD